MFLLVTIVSVTLGYAYAGFVGRRFGLKDWRRWMALTPFWVLAIAITIVLRTLNMSDPVPQAIQAFAIACLAGTVFDVLHARPRQRVPERDADSVPLR